MIIALIVIASCLTYLCVASWTFGFCSARCAAKWNEKHGYDGKDASYYHDEPEPWFAAILWPIYFLFVIALNRIIWFLIAHGEGKVEKSVKAKKLRIEIEKKIRVEQEKIEREAQEEIEEALRKEEAAA